MSGVLSKVTNEVIGIRKNTFGELFYKCFGTLIIQYLMTFFHPTIFNHYYGSFMRIFKYIFLKIDIFASKSFHKLETVPMGTHPSKNCRKDLCNTSSICLKLVPQLSGVHVAQWLWGLDAIMQQDFSHFF